MNRATQALQAVDGTLTALNDEARDDVRRRVLALDDGLSDEVFAAAVGEIVRTAFVKSIEASHARTEAANLEFLTLARPEGEH